jgi:phosphoglycerate dehydrogenase-like enzyme
MFRRESDMTRKVRIGFTRDFLGKDGKFALPGSGLKMIQEMPNVESEILTAVVPEITPRLIESFDMVVTRTYSRWTAQSLTGNSQLLSIHRNGVGYDRVNVPDLTNAGVMLCITPDAVRRPVAVAVITFLLALTTRLLTKHQMTRAGKWSEVAQCYGTGLTGKTLGSVGLGNIGQEIFRLAKPFGMRHIAFDPYVKPERADDVNVKLVDLPALLAESDFLSINCLLNKETRHLIGEKELRQMKKTAYLINTARGPVVDEAALLRALREGWIQGAALDVFEEEPTPPDNPLFKLDNVITTAHAMAFTDEYLEEVWQQIYRQVNQIIRGQMPEGLVNREVWNQPQFQAKLKKFQAAIK